MGSKKFRNRPGIAAPKREAPVSAATEPPPGPVRAGFLPAAILCLLGALIYSNTLHNPFCFDDKMWITGNFAIKNISDLSAIWNFYPARFLTDLSFAVSYHFSRLDVVPYHVTNITMHLAATLLVWRLTLLTMATPAMRADRIARRAGWIAFMAGLVFVAHPIQTQAVNYITQRTVIMAVIFYTGTLCLYVKSRLLAIGNERPAASAALYVLSLTTAVIGMFTKEIMITLPVMILVYEYAFLRAPGRNVSWKHVIPMLLTMAIIPLVMISSRPVEMSLSPAAWGTVFQGREYWREIKPTRISSLLTQVKVMAAYIRLILVPVNQNIDYAYPFVKTFSDPSLLASILFVGAALYSALRWFARYPLTAFGVLWFFITLLPESAVITLGDPMLEHRLYLPMAFFSVSLAATLYYLVKDGRFRAFVALMLAAAACYSVMSYKRNDVWRSELSIWNDVIRKSPMNARAYNNRGHLYEDMGETEMALADYNAAVSLAPKYPPARGSRGTLLYKRGDVDGALADYDVALKADSNDYLTYCNLGAIYIQKGEPDAAIGNLDKSIAINPHYDKAFNNRGVAYMDKGELGKAIADFDKAIWLNGDYPEAFDNRGMARLKGGEFAAAIADFDAALRIEPEFGRAYVNRAIARYNKGEYEKSRKDVLRAQGLGAYVPPDFIERLKYAPGAGG